MNWNDLLSNSFWHDRYRLLFNKDCRSMADLQDESIQCVVCSPPYWGLRKYAGLPDLIWGGDGSCGHQWGSQDRWLHRGSTKVAMFQKHGVITQDKTTDSFCSLCSAWKGQLGLEPTPELYLDHLIQIFREVRRVLRKDGVCFLNIGDSYNTSPAGNKQPSGFQQKSKAGISGALAQFPFDHARYRIDNYDQNARRSFGNLKPKDLCLIPFRLAIALQEDGWWVRSVIIWNKPNPMPESVKDRPSESHEYILMLTKSARYYWDAEAVREAYTKPLDRWGGDELVANGHSAWDEGTGQLAYRDRNLRPNPAGRNLRSVWTFPTQSFSGAHFATFPEKLVEICVKAATPEVGCCSKCGKPWVRIIQPSEEYLKVLNDAPKDDWYQRQENKFGNKKSNNQKKSAVADYQTLGWKPQCKCNAEKIPSIVLDPFAGSGTTLKVAAELNRSAIGYELSEPYCRLVVKRNEQGVIL